MIDLAACSDFQLLSTAEGPAALRISQRSARKALREIAYHCRKHAPLQPPWII